MPKTAVGLFKNPGIVDDVVREIETLGFPRNNIHTLDEPLRFEITGVMSFQRSEFEGDLIRELIRIGTTRAEAQSFIKGLQRGGVLILATGSDERVDAAADIMNRYGAVDIEQIRGAEPQSPGRVRESTTPILRNRLMPRRNRQPGGRVYLFTW